MLSNRNLYAELRLQPSASASDIRTAYRRAALLAHPDKGGNALAFHAITFAFEVLSCPTSRQLYDKARQQSKQQKGSRAKVSAAARKAPNAAAAGYMFTRGGKRKREPASADKAEKCQRTSPPSEEADDCDTTQCESPGGEDGDDTGHDKPAEAPVDINIYTSLKMLRDTLQHYSPTQRRTAISQMPTDVRSELLACMSGKYAHEHVGNASKTSEKVQAQQKEPHVSSWYRGTDVRTVKHVHKTTYLAQLRLRNLRVYTRAQTDFGVAVSHQMALTEARHAIEATDQDIWDKPHDFSKVFMDALTSSGIQQNEFGLSVFIFMRADEHISRSSTITSPVMPLEDAVAAHSRLLAARQHSWAQLRLEWVKLMRQTQHARLQHLTQTQAEAIADKAHLELLDKRLKHAVSTVGRALDARNRIREKMKRATVQLQRREKKTKAAIVKLSEQKQRAAMAARRKWYRRADLTMDEILQGPPQVSCT